MARKYPRLDSIRKSNPQKQCACCDLPGVERVWVQWTYMRGEDDDFPACHKHGQMARKDFDQFLEAVEQRINSFAPTATSTAPVKEK